VYYVFITDCPYYKKSVFVGSLLVGLTIAALSLAWQTRPAQARLVEALDSTSSAPDLAHPGPAAFLAGYLQRFSRLLV
jgi:hypothetical protein